MTRPDPIAHLRSAGYLDLAADIVVVAPGCITGKFPPGVYDLLALDHRFANGELHALHREIGRDLQDFRGYRNSFGNGSLQIIVDRATGAFYADVDGWNPYADVVNFFGHAFAEVVPNWFRRRFRRRASQRDDGDVTPPTTESRSAADPWDV